LVGKEEREDVPEEGNISNTSTNYLTGVEIETDYKNGKKITETRSRIERTQLKLEDFVR
jgi:hypothetical protein